MARLRNKFAKPVREMLRLVNDIQHQLTHTFNLLWQDLRRTLARRDIRIAEAQAAQLICQSIIRKAADELAATGGTETNRVVQGVLQRIAFVRESWWNVEDI